MIFQAVGMLVQTFQAGRDLTNLRNGKEAHLAGKIRKAGQCRTR